MTALTNTIDKQQTKDSDHIWHEMVDEPNKVLSIRNLSVAFTRIEGRHGYIRRIPALRRLNLELKAREIVAVVGSSGAGKSVLAHAILGILPKNAEVNGEILFNGSLLTERQLKHNRGRNFALVPQAVSFLDPLVKAKHVIYWAALRSGLSRKEARAAWRKALLRVGLDLEVGEYYPFQLSGGMARRVLLATAIVTNATILIADEPTPGLHPEAAQESLRLLREMADDGKTVLLITHDIEACLSIADKVAVFLNGAIVEVSPVSAFNKNGDLLAHPYSRALWNALPQNNFDVPAANLYFQDQYI